MIFGPTYPEKCISGPKQAKFDLVKRQVSQQPRIFAFLDKISPKRYFPVQKIKLELHHQIQHISISLNTQFHLKQTILNFWTKFAQTGYFWFITEKANIIIEFSIFELVQLPNFIFKKFEQISARSIEKILFIVK